MWVQLAAGRWTEWLLKLEIWVQELGRRGLQGSGTGGRWGGRAPARGAQTPSGPAPRAPEVRARVQGGISPGDPGAVSRLRS